MLSGRLYRLLAEAFACKITVTRYSTHLVHAGVIVGAVRAGFIFGPVRTTHGPLNPIRPLVFCISLARITQLEHPSDFLSLQQKYF